MSLFRAALTGKHDTLVRRAHQMLNAALSLLKAYTKCHRCKNVFYVFNVFFIFQTFFIFKNVGKVQSGQQINKEHFQNNSNEIDV